MQCGWTGGLVPFPPGAGLVFYDSVMWSIIAAVIAALVGGTAGVVTIDAVACKITILPF